MKKPQFGANLYFEARMTGRAAKRLLPPASLGVFILAACSGSGPGPEPDDKLGAAKQLMTGGTPSSCYPQAVSVFSQQNTCSAVVIAPGFALTAAHCAVLGGNVTVPTVVTGSQGSARITATYVNPSYDQCQPRGTTFAQTSGSDVAVVAFSGSVLPSGVSPANLATSAPPQGTVLDVIGYGITAAGGNTDRRLGQFTMGAASPNGQFSYTGTNAGICPGDSGGPIFRQGVCSGNPAPTLVGVVSAQPLGSTAENNCFVNNNNVAADVTSPGNAQFVANALAGKATPLTTTPPTCCNPVCPAGFKCQSGTCVQVCTTINPPECGPYQDSCGNSKNAGPCPTGFNCVQGLCQQVCDGGAINPPECGPYQDSCGNTRNAGPCPIGFNCVQGLCEQVCVTINPPECGPYQDSCGNTRNAGPCPTGFNCVQGLCEQVCVTINPPECGPYQDSCGNTKNAGSCPTGFNCVQGICQQVCIVINPPQCGPYADSCNNPKNAGPCPGNQVCSGGICQACQSTGCQGQCGSVVDNCGQQIECGPCEFCGDGICNGGEDCSWCPDCGDCGGGGGDGCDPWFECCDGPDGPSPECGIGEFVSRSPSATSRRPLVKR